MFSGYFPWKFGDLYPRIASSGRKMCHDSKNRPEFWIVTHLRWEFFVPKADPPPIPEMKGMLTCGAAIHCLPYHNILPEVPEIINSAASGVFQKRAEVTILQPSQHSTAFLRPIANCIDGNSRLSCSVPSIPTMFSLRLYCLSTGPLRPKIVAIAAMPRRIAPNRTFSDHNPGKMRAKPLPSFILHA